MSRVGARGAAALAVFVACGGRPPTTPGTPDDTPPECRANVASVIAASLGGMAAAQNGTRNEVLERQRHACERAVDAQRQDRAYQRAFQLEERRFQLEQRRLELEDQWHRADEERKRAAQLEAAPATRAPASEPHKLMILGGPGHDVYLGCLCGPEREDSVLSETGRFGRTGFALGNASLWKALSPFRSRFDSFSACDAFASNPPVVVHGDGTFVGRLTVNVHHPQAIDDPTILEWLTHTVCELP